MIPYSGKGFLYNKKKGLGVSVVEMLTREHKNTNIHFTMDNYFINIFTVLYYFNNKIILLELII